MKRKYAELEEQSKTLAYEKEHTNNEYHQYVQNLQEELHQTKEEVSVFLLIIEIQNSIPHQRWIQKFEEKKMVAARKNFQQKKKIHA